MTIGDLYCLPSSTHRATMERQTAIPILRGIPHDADPHFSPGDGNTLVWRSDAELGVENIWAMSWRGCAAHDLRHFAFSKDISYLSREARLITEGRSGGMFRQTHDCGYLTLAGPSVPNYERNVPVYHRPSCSPFWKEGDCHKMVHRE